MAETARLVLVDSGEDLVHIKELFIEYAKSLGVDLSFQGFEEELKSLPGKYSEPEGSIVLALVGEKPAGCAALRRITEQICEMKRLYVRDEFRGEGLGRELADRIIERAKELDYKYIRLDTLPTMERAQDMYRDMGFYEIEPYIFNPVEGTKYLEKKL